MFAFAKAVKKEFQHPIKLSFFPTFSISLLLLSIAFVSSHSEVSKFLWLTGTIIHFFFTLKVVSIWIHKTEFDIKHMNPAWFIPAVGNILVPVAGVSHVSLEISWFFYSVGLLFWVVLLVIFFNRIIFHSPLPEKLLPTFFILIAPPAVGFISYVKLTGDVDAFAKVLYYFGLFLMFLMLSQINTFKKIRFYLSWWAYSFPIAAITIASILMFHETHLETFKMFAYIFFGMLHFLIIMLLIKTGISVSKREICIEEE